jgi:hypothetical protein
MLLKAGVFFGPFLYYCIKYSGEIDLVVLFVVAIGSLVAVLIVHLLIRNFVPAKCPRCGAKAYARGYDPVCYHCSECGHIQKTKIGMIKYDGSSGIGP